MKKRILFIHHSTGGYLLQQGNIRKKLYAKTNNIELWDHAYNLSPLFGNFIAKFFPTFQTGLSNSNGGTTGIDFNLNISNNDIGSYLPIFDSNNPYLNKILEFDGVIFKMCFPSTKIVSDTQLAEIKSTYLAITDNLKKHSKTKFGIFTPPPLRMELTSIESAKRAVNLSKWMLENLENQNVRVFDFFGLLADLKEDSKYFGTLKREYCRVLWLDSHPNRKANVDVADKFVNFFVDLISSK
jgi:hypothetical protein